MKIAFTVCSNNYLAQAKTLGDTLLENNPDYRFIIILVDRLSNEINYANEIRHDIVTVENIGIDNFEDLWRKYDIIELNTCVKPMVFEYLFNKYPAAEVVFYFDPDIAIFNSFHELENEFDKDSCVLLTPHIVKPIPIDGKAPFENLFLNYGIYNLGFLGLKKNETTQELIKWWGERTVKFGFSKVEKGFFVDQLWFNLVPLFFQKVKVLQNLGYNIGPWNLHERTVSFSDNRYYVNSVFKLTFFHFSNYKYSSPEIIAKYYNRFQLNETADLKKLYQTYLGWILKNKVEQYSEIECYFVNARKKYHEDLELKKKEQDFKNLRENKWLYLKHQVKALIPDFLLRMYKAAKTPQKV